MMVRNNEVIYRLREAARYQRKAVRCLIPDRMSGHLDVIGNELKLILTEAAQDILKDCVGQALRRDKKDVIDGFLKSEDGITGPDSKRETDTKRNGSKKIDIL
ncbi:MAG: hypothetical protein IJ065_13750 [Eubacterium sp.]|nr:hypothetical protein [Eubacterium sp.]